MSSPSDPERIVARAIHDARCGVRSAHRTPAIYERCVGLYADHGALAVGALWEAGYLRVDEDSRVVPWLGP